VKILGIARSTCVENYSGLSKSNFKDHYGDLVITQCLGNIAKINEFSASNEML